MEQLTEINNFLLIFPGTSSPKKIPTEELNEILLHAVTNGWEKQSYLQVWYFEMETLCETCAMFEQIEIYELVYEVQTTSKNIPMEDDNCDSHASKIKGGKTNLHTWSSPRKEKNRKPPTGENVVPCKLTIRVNSNGEKQGGIPKK